MTRIHLVLTASAALLAGTAFAMPAADTGAINNDSRLSSRSGGMPHIGESPKLNNTSKAADAQTRPTVRPRTFAATPVFIMPVGRCVVGSRALTAGDAATCSRQGGIWTTDSGQQPVTPATGVPAQAKATAPRVHRADPDSGPHLDGSQRTGE